MRVWVESTDYEKLTESWRAKASLFRIEADAEGAARPLESAARDLEQWVAARSHARLTLREAAELVQRDTNTIGRAIRDGRLKNYGERHKPRVRAGDVASCFPPRGVARSVAKNYDASADARSILEERRGVA